MQLLPARAGVFSRAEDDSDWRSGMRGIRKVSGTLAGLSAQATEHHDTHQEIITYRQLDPSDMTVDPGTGKVRLVDPGDDPLAGEVFDTPEFQTSQEFANQSKGTPTSD